MTQNKDFYKNNLIKLLFLRDKFKILNKEELIIFNNISLDKDILTIILDNQLISFSQLLDCENIKKYIENKENIESLISLKLEEKTVLYIIDFHNLKNNKEIFFKLHNKTIENKNVLDCFKNILDNNMLNLLLEKNKINAQLLNYYDNNLDLSKRLLENNIFPYSLNIKSFNLEAFNKIDKKIILNRILSKDGLGYLIYDMLPDNLQNDMEIIKAVFSVAPHKKLNFLTFTSFNDFISKTDNFELNSIISALEKYNVIKNNKDILDFFKLLKEEQLSSYVELMGGPVFDSHGAQDFIMKLKDKFDLINKFCQTDFGNNLVNYKISNFNEYMKYERNLYEVYDKLFIFYERNNILEKIDKNNLKNSNYSNKI